MGESHRHYAKLKNLDTKECTKDVSILRNPKISKGNDQNQISGCLEEEKLTTKEKIFWEDINVPQFIAVAITWVIYLTKVIIYKLNICGFYFI